MEYYTQLQYFLESFVACAAAPTAGDGMVTVTDTAAQ